LINNVFPTLGHLNFLKRFFSNPHPLPVYPPTGLTLIGALHTIQKIEVKLLKIGNMSNESIKDTKIRGNC
jgi:hypothetical protein